jgi:hypothetical protein
VIAASLLAAICIATLSDAPRGERAGTLLAHSLASATTREGVGMSFGTIGMHRISGISQRLALALFFALVLLWSGVAAAFPDLRAFPDCACTDRKVVEALRDQIATADTLDAARELALPPAEQARAALTRARWLMPFSTSLAAAETRLSAYQNDVQNARSPEQVAARFGALVKLASSNSYSSDASFSSNCHYSTGEVIVIVIGFILGIIPGIILMFLLC